VIVFLRNDDHRLFPGGCDGGLVTPIAERLFNKALEQLFVFNNENNWYFCHNPAPHMPAKKLKLQSAPKFQRQSLWGDLINRGAAGTGLFQGLMA
jgi:hypothetical protein